MQTVYDLLRRLVDDHNWRQERDRLTAHGVINAADPSYVPPIQGNPTQLTPEQLYIAQLEQQLAQLRNAAPPPPNAEQMRQYAYPTAQQVQQQPNVQAQPNVQDFAAQYQAQPMAVPQSPPGVPTQEQMRQYAYPGTEQTNAQQQPQFQYNPVTPFQ